LNPELVICKESESTELRFNNEKVEDMFLLRRTKQNAVPKPFFTNFLPGKNVNMQLKTSV
jgi:hypothetical protein